MHARGDNGRKSVRAAGAVAFFALTLPGGALAGEIKIAFVLEGEHRPPYTLVVRQTDAGSKGKETPPYRVDYGIDQGPKYTGFISAERFESLVARIKPDLDALEKSITTGPECGTRALINVRQRFEGPVCGSPERIKESRARVSRVMETFRAYVDFSKPPKKR